MTTRKRLHKTRSQSGATSSNAGDRYHFVYVGRKVLDILHSQRDLRQICIEGIAEPDQETLGGSPDAFLAVDVSEYYGGSDLASASRVHLVQVKFSPTHPSVTWTIARLTTSRKNKTGKKPSVIEKLAQSFITLKSGTPKDTRIDFAIHTNQQLDAELLRELKEIRSTLCRAESQGTLLRNNVSQTIRKLKKATGLSWDSLAEFLLAWDIDGFGSAGLQDAESALFRQLDSCIPQAGLRLENLISSIFAQATPGYKKCLGRAEALALLHLTEDRLEPAPATNFDSVACFATRDSKALVKAISEHSGIVIVNGRSGSGKTTSLCLMAEQYTNVVFFDCFAGGRGLRPGSERFPYRVCFTQIVNDLDRLYQTGILATTELEYLDIARVFRKAVSLAAHKARQNGHKLVLIFDAIDNAFDYAAKSGIHGADSFVPILLSMDWPLNCVVLISLRTENISKVIPLHSFPTIGLEGFDYDETVKHTNKFAIELAPDSIRQLFNRTRGNPRVQANILRVLTAEGTTAAANLIETTAKSSAFEFYDAQARVRIGGFERRFLAVLYEARQPVSQILLSDVLKIDSDKIEATIQLLNYGLTIEEGYVLWRDQDFLDWVGLRCNVECVAARTSLAEYCESSFAVSDYARSNLSYHFWSARRDQALLTFWTDARIRQQLRAVHPHEDLILDDLKYAMLSARRTGDLAQALSFLAKAADIARGRDSFEHILRRRPRIAVQCGFWKVITENDGDTEGAAQLLHLARLLKFDTSSSVESQDLFDRARSLKLEQARAEDEGTQLRFSVAEIIDAALFRAMDLESALEYLTHWEPRTSVLSAFTEVASEWSVFSGGEYNPFVILEKMDLEASAKSAAFLGVLSGSKPNSLPHIDPNILFPQCEQIASVRSSYGRELEGFKRHLFRATENLLCSSNHFEATRLLAGLIGVNSPYGWRDRLIPFARAHALKQVAGLELFTPETYCLPDKKEEHNTSYENQELRARLGRIYAVELNRANAMKNHDSAEILAEVERCIALEWTDTWQRTDVEFLEIIGDMLETVCLLPTAEAATIVRILENSRSNRKDYSTQDARYIKILAQDKRYQAIAERLARELIEKCAPPAVRASEGSDILTDAAGGIASFDLHLARIMMLKAREIAGEVDSRIEGRSRALIDIGLRVSNQGGGSFDDMFKLYSLFVYWRKLDQDFDSYRLQIPLHLLSRVSFRTALDACLKADEEALIDLEDSLGAAASGAIFKNNKVADVIWPAMMLFGADTDKQFDRDDVVERCLRALPTPAAERALQKCIREALTRSPQLRSIIYHFKRLSKLAADLALEMPQEFDNIDSYEAVLDNAEQTPIREIDDSVTRAAVHSVTSSEPLPSDVDQLLDMQTAILRKISGHDMAGLIRDFAPTLTTKKYLELSVKLSDWAVDADTYDAITVWGCLAECASTDDRTTTSLRDILTRILTPKRLALMLNPYYSRLLDIVLSAKPLEGSAAAMLIVDLVGNSLEALDSDALFGVVSRLTTYLKRKDAEKLFSDILGHSAVGQSQLSPHKPHAENEIDCWLEYVVGLLQHPVVSYRWASTYALSEIYRFNRQKVLPFIVDALSDKTSGRWMTKREWAAFALQHCSIVNPTGLAGVAHKLYSAARDKTFPHAKVRYHLIEALKNIESAVPGTLATHQQGWIGTALDPISVTKETFPQFGKQKANKKETELPIHFSWDTSGYWFEPLERCFKCPPNAVAKWVSKWITQRLCLNQEMIRKKTAEERKFPWQSTSNDHGSQPSIDIFELYLEYHGMMLSAYHLLKTYPALQSDWSNVDESRWADWCRYHLVGMDPSLVGRLVSPIPATSHAEQQIPFVEWRQKSDDSHFSREVVQGSWICLSGYFSCNLGERTSRSHVDSALVSSKTAQSLLRLLEMPGGHHQLPSIDLNYDVIIPDAERILLNKNHLWHLDHDFESNDPEFELKPTTVEWHQEMPFHAMDPFWPSHGREYGLLVPDMSAQLNLEFDQENLSWRDTNGNTIAVCRVWANHASSAQANYSGYRLMIERTALQQYSRIKNMDVIFRVTLARNLSSESRRTGQETKQYEYDLGTSKSFLLSTIK